MLCPLMLSRTGNTADAECVRHRCAWWHARDGQCAAFIIADMASREYERDEAAAEREAMRRRFKED